MKTNRNTAIDVLKIFALFHMMYDHLYITIYSNSLTYPIIDFIDAIIPLCPALFLFLSGYSLSYSSGFLKIRKRIISAAILAGIGSLFFIAEHGFQYPDFLFAPGILYTIAVNTLLCTIAGNSSKYSLQISGGLSLISILIFISLRSADTTLFIFNGGYEPLLPTLSYGLIGFFTGELFRKKSLGIKFQIFTGFTAAFIFVLMSITYGFFSPLFPDTGRYTLTKVFQNSLKIENLFSPNVNAGLFYARIWNFDTICFFYSLTIVFMVFSFTSVITKSRKIKIHPLLLSPSHFLLANYIIHLCAIAVLTLFTGFNSFSVYGFITMYILFVCVIYALSIAMSLFFNRTKRSYQGISGE